jgi:uncharacterized protein YkwD
MRLTVFVLLSLFLISCSSGSGPSDCSNCADLLKPEVLQMLDLVNEARSKSQVCGTTIMPSVSPLLLNARLITAAQKHSEDMRLAGVMTHTTPAGAKHYSVDTTFDQRILQEGYEYSFAGENVAQEQISAAQVMEDWLNSPGHCQNIMSEKFSEVGFGYDGNYWTQDFARPLD